MPWQITRYSCPSTVKIKLCPVSARGFSPFFSLPSPTPFSFFLHSFPPLSLSLLFSLSLFSLSLSFSLCLSSSPLPLPISPFPFPLRLELSTGGRRGGAAHRARRGPGSRDARPTRSSPCAQAHVRGPRGVRPGRPRARLRQSRASASAAPARRSTPASAAVAARPSPRPAPTAAHGDLGHPRPGAEAAPLRRAPGRRRRRRRRRAPQPGAEGGVRRAAIFTAPPPSRPAASARRRGDAPRHHGTCSGSPSRALPLRARPGPTGTSIPWMHPERGGVGRLPAWPRTRGVTSALKAGAVRGPSHLRALVGGRSLFLF